MDPSQAMKNNMAINISVFKEPRGVMRILQFIFSICAFATTTGFKNSVEFKCQGLPVNFTYSYPFRLDHEHGIFDCGQEKINLQLYGDFSSDAQFFVATGVLSFLFCIGIIIVYILFDHMYQTNEIFPLGDFFLTVTLAVFWLSGSAAWANGLNGLKGVTGSILTSSQCANHICDALVIGPYFGLEISVLFGFLNFFLWASDLWFLYKETPWFKMRQQSSAIDPTA